MKDLVVLVNDANEPIGTALKDEVHHSKTPLHRGFSLFVFRKNGDLLLQERSSKKKTFPRVWSNSCCGHPSPGESVEDAAKRRAADELGLKLIDIRIILPDFRYRAEMNGIVENEICPVLVSFTADDPQINREEVEAIRWVPWKEWLEEIQKNPGGYSPWCVEETHLLAANTEFGKIYKKRICSP